MADKIAIVGAGAMGGAMVRGLIARGAARPQDIIVNEPDRERRDALASEHGVTAGAGLPDGVRGARAVVLAVKPQAFASLAGDLCDGLAPEQLVLSIMAGVRLATLTDGLGTGRVVRAMPNMPAQVGRGVAVWMGGSGTNGADRALAARLLGALGTEIEVAAEDAIDAATAVHGSGPAYVFLVAEAWLEAAQDLRLDHTTAETLVRETLAGSVKLWEASGQDPATLRAAVTSPGGTTEAAIQALEARGLREAFKAALQAAYQRSQELG